MGVSLGGGCRVATARAGQAAVRCPAVHPAGVCRHVWPPARGGGEQGGRPPPGRPHTRVLHDDGEAHARAGAGGKFTAQGALRPGSSQGAAAPRSPRRTEHSQGECTGAECFWLFRPNDVYFLPSYFCYTTSSLPPPGVCVPQGCRGQEEPGRGRAPRKAGRHHVRRGDRALQRAGEAGGWVCRSGATRRLSFWICISRALSRPHGPPGLLSRLLGPMAAMTSLRAPRPFPAPRPSRHTLSGRGWHTPR
jgi:hypothetical protein